MFQDASDPLVPHLTKDYLDSLSKQGTWADAVAIQGCARMLGRDIHIVTSQEQSTKDGYLVNKVCAGGDNSAEPFLLGHVGEFHYMGLGKSSSC